MYGLMMDRPLLISSLLTHAESQHGEREIVSRRVEGDIHRTTYRELGQRARQLAHALAALGIAQGERVATLAWNGYRHLELYYAVSGSGAVLHTLNPRLHPDQLAWIVNHAEDQVLCFDMTFLPLVEAIVSRVPTVRHFVAMTDRAHMPTESGIPNLICYEDWVNAHEPDFDWPELDERTASSLCYTSGTTGNPKGVLYSHRSTLLHSYAAALPDSLDCAGSDTILPVVPMFHVNAWGLPYIACMVGAKLVFPGPQLDGPSLYDLFEAEGVTLSAGVPTVWQGLLNHVDSQGLAFSTMRRTIVGGSACPPAMLRAFQQRHQVQVLHAWGMTETSPLGTSGVLKAAHQALPEAAREALQLKQGRAVFGVEMKIIDAQGAALAHDGRTSGELMVRGPWIASGYFRSDSAVVHGWFPTGDVATIDADGFMQITDRSKDVIKSGGEWISSIDVENIAMAHPAVATIDADGFMQITDRSKDVIKSGGEWISSIDIENIAMGHPAVAMAACIAARHPKWDERPLLVVVKKPGAEVSRDALLQSFEGRIAKRWMPDDVIFVDSIPLGATGKMQKSVLRDAYQDHLVNATP